MMKRIKKLTTSILASFDWMVSQVENHEALVTAAIREACEATARAKVQLARVRQDGQNMRRRLVELQENERLWKERALKTAEADEKKALECIRRQKRVLREIGELETQERAHAGLEKQLSEDITKLDEKLSRLRQQRNLLRTRESRAEAVRVLQSEDSSLLTEIDDIFERWESKITQYEIEGESASGAGDSLESEFAETEQEDELRAELQRLRESPELT